MTTPFTARLAAFVAALGVTFALLAGAGRMQIAGAADAVQLAQSAASSAHAG